MLDRLIPFLKKHAPAPQPVRDVSQAERNAFSEQLRDLDRDPYLFLADDQLRVISVFDDLHYDRADMDMLAGPMRARVLAKLAPMGVVQITGHILEQRDLDIRFIMPRFRALGASPFDAAHDTPASRAGFLYPDAHANGVPIPEHLSAARRD